MKRFILSAALFACLGGMALAAEPVSTQKSTVTVYANLKGEDTGNVHVDFGDGDFTTLRSDDGRKFRSLAAALNYLSSKGWKVVAAFSEEEDHYFLIEREATKDEANIIVNRGLK